MVESSPHQSRHESLHQSLPDSGVVWDRPARSFTKVDARAVPNRTHRGRIIAIALTTAMAMAVAVALLMGILGGSESTRPAASSAKTTERIINLPPTQLIAASKATTAVPATPTTAAISKPNAPESAPKPLVPKTGTPVPAVQGSVADGVSEPSIAKAVAEVTAAGIEPGLNWSWSMGDTETRCGFIAGTGRGCTFSVDGDVRTVFGGSPTLALVAHELANAEALNDATPSLMNKVSEAESGSSWSTTDALASCLVADFMRFQDDAAGTWRCPDALATFVAKHIHDTVPLVTQLTLACGKTSQENSTLTFTASAGVLTVKGPSAGAISETVAAGTPVTVSGIGTFSGRDQGGVVKAGGICTR